MKQAVIDRFEGDVAVCEDCETGLVNLNLPGIGFPRGPKREIASTCSPTG